MIEAFMGTDNLYTALRAYLKERSAAGGATTYPHLLDAFTARMNSSAIPAGHRAKGVNFADRFDQWISTNGFPLVTVTLSRTDNRLHLTQERFLLGNGTLPSAMDRAWNIPFTYVTKAAGDTPAVLLSRQTEDVSVQWLEKTQGSCF